MPLIRAGLPNILASGSGVSGASMGALLDDLPDGIEAYDAGFAVALVYIPNVGRRFCLCGSNDHAENFIGFIHNPSDTNPIVVSTRGSVVTPKVEGGGVLTPNEPVFLSVTPGFVTQTLPEVGLMVRVGFAVGDDKLVINTDFRVGS